MLQIKLKYTRQRIEDPNLHIAWNDIVGDISGNTALQDALDNKQNVGDYATHNDLSTVEDSLQNIINQTKDDINGELNKKQDKGNYALSGDSYTKAESDSKYALKGDIPTDVYTKTQVDNKLADKLDVSAYTKYDDTQVKADIAKKADKTYVDTELTKKQDKGNYVSATTLNDYALKSEIPSVEGLASETYVLNKIKEVVGTAPEALDTLGEIADKLSGDDDAIAAINQVLDGKVSKDEYNTNQQSINNSLTDLSNNKADKSEIPTIPLFRTINGQIITGDTTNIVIDTDLTDYYTKTESDNKYALKDSIPTDVYTKTQVDNKLSEKLDISAYTPYDDTQVKADIQANTTAIAGKQDKGNYALSGTSYTKQESDAKYLTEHQSLADYAKTADVNTALADKQDKGDYVSATTLNDYALKRDVYTKEQIDKEYIQFKATVIYDSEWPIDDGPSDYNQSGINKWIYNNKADKTALNGKQDTLVSGTNIKTVNGSSLLGSGNLSVNVDELEADKVKFTTKGEVFVKGEEITNGYNNEHVQYMLFISDYAGPDGFTLTCDGGYSFKYDCGNGKVTFTNVEGTYEQYGEYATNLIVKLNTAIPLNNVSISYGDAMSENGCHAYIATLEQEVKVETLPEVITNYYTKTEIGNMVGNINNALNGLSFWKGTQEEYDTITTKDDNTIYYII